MQEKTIWKRWAWIVVGLMSPMILIQLFSPGSITRFAGFGERFEHRYIDRIAQINAYIKPNSGGYDGQFYAQIATDPSLKNSQFEDAIDEPAYRSRRILLPLIAHLMAFGNPTASIWIYCSINIVCWYLFALLVWQILKVRSPHDFAKWAACVLSMGVMDSVKYSLTDLPSILVVLFAIRIVEKRQLGAAGLFLSSIFLKETNILSGIAMIRVRRRLHLEWKNLLFWACTAFFTLVSFFLWYRYVNSIFGTFAGVNGNFDWPFSSMVRNLWAAIQELFSGNIDDRYLFRITAVVGLSFQAIWLTTQWQKIANPLLRLGLIYALLFIFLGDLVWWGYWAVCRVALPMTIAFNLLYNSKRFFWPGLILANLTAIHAVYRFP